MLVFCFLEMRHTDVLLHRKTNVKLKTVSRIVDVIVALWFPMIKWKVFRSPMLPLNKQTKLFR